MKNDFTERWLIDWSIWYSQWIERSSIGYPSSTLEHRAAYGPGSSGVPSCIVPKIDKPWHVGIVDRVIVGSDKMTKEVIYWRYQFHVPMIKLTEKQRELCCLLTTGRSSSTYRRKIRRVKDRIKHARLRKDFHL